MFTQTWRTHWGLKEDPFACEDADKDLVLTSVDPAAVHSGFDRIFGNPKVPAPGIVFGEKGSGKSGLRLMMERWIDAHNQKAVDGGVFAIEYIDFDSYIENFQHHIGVRGSAEKAATKVLERWEISDHLDAILSLGVTKLVDELLEGGEAPADLAHKQRVDLLLLTALYYNSPARSTAEALRGMRSLLRIHNVRGGGLWAGRILATVGAGMLGTVPHLWEAAPGSPGLWYWGGGVVLAAVWLWTLVSWINVSTRSSRAASSVRVLQRDSRLLRDILLGIRPKDRNDYVLPVGSDAATRYDLLGHFVGILKSSGYAGCYVLMDRVDEPSLLSGHDERMRRFLEKILDIKLLQYPGLALKLFLPIEMESIYRNATPEELKRMRLDKSNLIPELKWTGQELYEISNQRLRACLEADSKIKDLSDLFNGDFDFQHLRETLTSLGTPRYAFGFLSSLFLEHVRELPNEMGVEDDRWKCSRSHFDVVRASWIDRTGVLRRSLN